VNGKSLKVLEYKLPNEGAYAVLETYTSMKSTSRIIHVLNFGVSNKIRVGRGQDANVRITDISVSRDHSDIVYKDGKFYQIDLSSKFGSLKSFDKPIEIK